MKTSTKKTAILIALDKNDTIFIPKFTELIDQDENIHSTIEDQTVSRENFAIMTDLGQFVPSEFDVIFL